MMPQNSVDAYPFWFVIGVFAVIFGNLIYESVIVHWLIERELKRCEAVCCIEGDDDE
jgi:hypothetical protein